MGKRADKRKVARGTLIIKGQGIGKYTRDAGRWEKKWERNYNANFFAEYCLSEVKHKKLREGRDVNTMKALIMPKYCLGEMKQNGDDLEALSTISVSSPLKY